MASTSAGQNKDPDNYSSKPNKISEDESELPKDFEPGASRASVLLSTGSIEEESVTNEFEDYKRKSSCISEIEKRVSEVELGESISEDASLEESGKKRSDVIFSLYIQSTWKGCRV